MAGENGERISTDVAHLSIYLSMVLHPFVGPWSLFSFLILYTVGRTPRTRATSHIDGIKAGRKVRSILSCSVK
jgi:hypothetical protein